MVFRSIEDLNRAIEPALTVTNDNVTIRNRAAARAVADRLAHTAALAPDRELRARARWLIKMAAIEAGAVPASILGLYEAIGRGETGGFTVPAINLRGLTYEMARAVFRAARTERTGAVVFEIARSEIGYTFQQPAEYAAVVLAAALKEDHPGPVFLQGDHFQVSARRFGSEGDRELGDLRRLIEDAIRAGFYNIDIDASTLVDLGPKEILEQQRRNFEITAELIAHVRSLQPPGIEISIGGEIGEVGGKNSTAEELRAFMAGLGPLLEKKYHGIRGISKISVQTGTSHGGVPLPGGGVAEVRLDFDTLTRLSKVAREEFGLAGAVQHGASTLPLEWFGRFPETGAVEIHLATEFQNLFYEHPALPKDLRDEIYRYLEERHADERHAGESETQFIYRTRKKAFGPFKQRIWSLPPDTIGAITADLEVRFRELFRRLHVSGTDEIVHRFVRPRPTHFLPQDDLRAA